MKKILSFIFVILVIFSAFVLPVAAEDDYQTISEDLKRIYFNGKTYHYVEDDSAVSYALRETRTVTNYVLSEKQQKIFEEVYLELESMYDSHMILSVYYKNGENFYGTYIEESYLDLYYGVLAGNGQEVYVRINSYDGIELEKPYLLKEGPTVELEDYMDYESFEVLRADYDRVFSDIDGTIYVDQATMNFYYSEEEPSMLWPPPSITAYKIVDEDMLTLLRDKYENYYFGFRNTEEDITDVIFFIVLILFFGLTPLVVLVFGIILLVKSKKPYKSYMIAIVSFAAAELLVFIFLMAQILRLS